MLAARAVRGGCGDSGACGPWYATEARRATERGSATARQRGAPRPRGARTGGAARQPPPPRALRLCVAREGRRESPRRALVRSLAPRTPDTAARGRSARRRPPAACAAIGVSVGAEPGHSRAAATPQRPPPSLRLHRAGQRLEGGRAADQPLSGREPGGEGGDRSGDRGGEGGRCERRAC